VALAKEHLKRNKVRLAKRLAIGYLAFWAPWDAGRMKSVVSGMLNYPVVLVTLFLFIAGAIRKRPAFDDLILGAVIFSFVSIFAFFTAYGSYFNMLLPLVLLLLIRLASTGRRIESRH
jgi:hypothetical protein